MIARGLMDILLGKPFYVYIAIIMTKLVTLPRFMIVVFPSSAPTCIIHAKVDELFMLKEGPILAQDDKFKSDPTNNAAGYTPHEGCNEQVHFQNAAKELDETKNNDWCKDITLADEYSAYSEKFINILSQFDVLSDRYLGSIKAGQHWVELEMMYSRPAHSVSKRPRPKARVF